jgi:hypothetical protein
VAKYEDNTPRNKKVMTQVQVCGQQRQRRRDYNKPLLFFSKKKVELKMQTFSKSRAITQKILNKSRRKYPGAHLHMLINIPVKFHDSRSTTF